MAARRKAKAPAHRGCTYCHFTGWRVHYVIVEQGDGRMSIESGPARRCDCDLGQYGAAKDAERKEGCRISDVGYQNPERAE